MSQKTLKNNELYYILLIPQNGSSLAQFKGSFRKHFKSDKLQAMAKGEAVLDTCRQINELAKPFTGFYFELLIIEKTAFEGVFHYAAGRTPDESDILFWTQKENRPIKGRYGFLLHFLR